MIKFKRALRSIARFLLDVPLDASFAGPYCGFGDLDLSPARCEDQTAFKHFT